MDNKYTNMREGMNPHSTNQTNTFHLFIFTPMRSLDCIFQEQCSEDRLKFYDAYMKAW